MARQTRIKGTDADLKPVPPAVREAIVDLKKRSDARKKAKERENDAQASANKACLDGGYKVGDKVSLDDESPPLVFEITAGEPVVKVRVAGRPKKDEIGVDDDDGEE